MVLTGQNWQGDATVRVFTNDHVFSSWNRNVYVSVAADGTITDSFNLPNWFVADYSVVATGLQTGRVATTTFTDAQPPQPNLEQCRNGAALTPNGCLALGGNAGWVGGNAGGSNSHYVEGFSIPYRLVMENLPLTGPDLPITVVLGYDIKHSGAHAIDFLTHYDRLEPHAGFGHTAEVVNPTSGVSGLSSTTGTFAIPTPSSTSSCASPVAGQPTTQFNSLPAAERLMTLFGGTISDIHYVSQGCLTNSQAETRISITFTPDSSNAVLAWGGHIARSADWGVGNAATGINGSPYHMRKISWTLNNLGNEDRSLSADAVIPTGTVVINKVAVGGNNTFSYTGTGTGISSSFNITTSGGSGSQTFSNILTGAKTVTEGALPADWAFTSLVCSDPDSGTTVSGQTASIDLDANETVTCTYTNTRQVAALTVTKSPSATNVCNGSSVTYTYVVTNTGNVALTVNLVDDNGTPGTPGDDIDVDGGAGFNLTTGASQTFTATASITGTVTNTVAATGTSAGSQTATATADATVTGRVCTITVTKTPSATNVCNGSSVTYTYTVTNNSGQFIWTGGLSDSVLGVIDATITLDPGETETFTASGAISGVVTNTATATGAFDDPNSTSASASASATVTGRVCTITVTKTPSATNVCNGSSVTYTYTVTNNSGQFIWTGGLSDSVLGVIDATITLDPGETETFTASGAISGVVTNTATATGAFDDPNSTSASASASATVTGRVCTITVTKTPSATNVCNGSSVTYTYTVTNNSGQFIWTGGLSDSVLGVIDATITLDPGETETFTASGAISGVVTNTATATGAFDDPNSTSASASASATVTGRVCTITVTKTPSATNVCNGSSVTYTYTVTNNSGQFIWTGGLSDSVLGVIDATITLDPGETETFTASGAISGVVTNTATATGAFDDPNSTSASASASATVTGRVCTITVTKTPSATNVCNGSSVTYTYTVTNNSGQFIWTGGLSDSVLGVIDATITLDPGETETFTASGAISGVVTNTATATGAFDDPNSTSASASASATVTGRVCRIIVVKQTLPDGDPQTFAFSGDLSGTIGDGQSITVNVLSPGTYTTTETVPTGWDLTIISCNDANSSGDIPSATATYNVAFDETITCTFTNTKRGHIIVDKITIPSGASQLFSFDASGGTDPAYTDFNLTDAAPPNNQELKPGTYSVKEMVPIGWVLTGIGGSTDPNTPFNCTVTGSGGSTGLGDLADQTAT